MRPRILAAALAVVAWFAVLLQLYLSLRLAIANGNSIGGGIVIFLGYFTVLTNILVCVALTFPLLAPASAPGRFFARPAVAGGVAASITLVALAYHLLLRNVWDPQGLQWLADVLLHYVVPILYVLYWWLVVPKASLRWTHPLLWAGYPAAYLAYALVRGSMIGSYPYPFIDVAVIGYQQTVLNAMGLLVGFIALGLLFVALGRLQGEAIGRREHAR